MYHTTSIHCHVCDKSVEINHFDEFQYVLDHGQEPKKRKVYCPHCGHPLLVNDD